MAINKNHEFEELNGVKCGIVEKAATEERAHFLQRLLQHNGYTVVLAASAPHKAAAAPVAVEGAPEVAPTPPPPTTYTIGVTDVTFNPINAIFGRLLKTEDGRIVTLAYWQGKEAVAQDDIPYYEKR